MVQVPLAQIYLYFRYKMMYLCWESVFFQTLKTYDHENFKSLIRQCL